MHRHQTHSQKPVNSSTSSKDDLEDWTAGTIPSSTIHGTKIHIAKTSDFWYIEGEEGQERPDKYIDTEQSLDYE
jgi:hypothetical protein